MLQEQRERTQADTRTLVHSPIAHMEHIAGNNR